MWLAYVLLGAGAAVENIFPPVPSDTVVVLGGILSDRGGLQVGTVLAVAWVSNVSAALLIYALARRHGRGIFQTRWGRRLLRPHQLNQLSGFYERYGLIAIFGSRFLPVLRVLIPVFAGITKVGFVRTAIPLASASLAWYTVMVFAGVFASRNIERLFQLLGAANNWLLGVALALIVVIAFWWFRSRHDREDN
jgi:membrane protein DedA with SNARE-associated domain